MSKRPQSLLGIFGGLVISMLLAAMACTVSAQVPEDPDDAQERTEALRREFKKFSKELEAEIEKREKQASISRQRLESYREDLIQEYKRLAAQSAAAVETGDEPSAGADTPQADAERDGEVDETAGDPTDREEIDSGELRQRLNLIRLQLWELERIEPNIEATIESAADLQQKITKFVIAQQRNGRAANNPILRAEIQRLYQRIIDINRRQRTSRSRASFRNGFHVIEPLGIEDDGDPRIDDQTALERGWAVGPIQAMRKPLQRILKLRWNGERIELDRDHWDLLFGGKDLATVSKIVRNQLSKRGVDLPPNEQYRRTSRLKPERLSLLVENLQYQASAGDNRSRSVGYSASDNTLRFSTDSLNATVVVDAKELDFELREPERESPRRTLRLTTIEGGGIRIVVFGEQTFFLEQKANGNVVFFYSHENKVDNRIAESFVELYGQDPELVEETIFPFLRHFGMIVPADRQSDLIVNRLLNRIRNNEGVSKQEFDRLLVELDDEEYEVREAASAQLERRSDRYLEFAKLALAEQTLSLEVSTRLKRVINMHDNSGAELDPLIDRLGLLEDDEYLRSLLDRVTPEDAARIRAKVE